MIVLALAADLNESRAAAWRWCRARLESLDLQLTVVTEADEPWNKPSVVNEAVRGLDSPYLDTPFAVIDADVALDPTSLMRAIAAVEGGAPWAVAHREVRRLSRERTAALLREDPTSTISTKREDLERPAYQVEPGGGFFACSRAAWETVGGMDPRFRGYAGEDVALGMALTTLVGAPFVGAGTCFHLWHEPQPRDGLAENLQRVARYQRARTSPKRMRELIAERAIPAGS